MPVTSSVILVLIVYSAPADRTQLLHIWKGKSLITTRLVLVHDSAGADVAFCRVEESGTEIEKGGNPDVGDPILDDASFLCALYISAPHQTGEMLGDSPL
jgi:hypothetical protein